jgi:hypothetical protein
MNRSFAVGLLAAVMVAGLIIAGGIVLLGQSRTELRTRYDQTREKLQELKAAKQPASEEQVPPARAAPSAAD